LCNHVCSTTSNPRHLPSMSTRKAATGLLVLAAASLLLLASPAMAARGLKSVTPGTLAAASAAWTADQASGSAISGAQAALKQEAAAQGQPAPAAQEQPLTISYGTEWCITLSDSAPGSIRIFTSEYIVSCKAAAVLEGRSAAAGGCALPCWRPPRLTHMRTHSLFPVAAPQPHDWDGDDTPDRLNGVVVFPGDRWCHRLEINAYANPVCA